MTVKRYRKKDPQAKDEAVKYKNPVPSRQYIMQYLSDMGKPMSAADMIEAFGLESAEKQEALQFRLKAMVRDAELIRTRRSKYGLVSEMELVQGVVLGHKEGYGFLVPDRGGDDIFISPHFMRTIFPGDRVLLRISGYDRRGRSEGAIVEVVEHNTQSLVGRYFNEKGVSYVVPESKNITNEILVPEDQRNHATNGQYVVVEITEQPNSRGRAIGKISEVLGEHMAPGLETQIAIRTYDLPFKWPDDVLKEIKDFKETVTEEDLVNRTDLRHLPFVTIDGENAKDFDDAVYCEPKKGGGWYLYVAIADVSYYLNMNSALNMEAYNRGNSVYFPSRVIPMLPEALSNELCSLKPHEDRLCMVCEMTVSAEGILTRTKLYEGVIRSHARLIYDNVAAMLDGRSKKNNMALLPQLQNLYQLYHKLNEQKIKRHALEFETTETRIVFGKHQRIQEIVPVQRNDAHKIIEECMLLANVAVAKFLKKHNMPTLYRVHEGPDPAKLEALKEFLRDLGIRVSWRDEPTPEDYANIIKKIKDRPDHQLIQTVLLRSLRQAIYSPQNKGHFGLAYDSYVHFTSPIRRYPDVLVHRAIRHVLQNKPAEEFAYSIPLMQTIGEHTSRTERRADEATRDVMSWLKCEYMQKNIGKEFSGIITGVVGFGVFVELTDIYAEGLLHITSLTEDYYHFDPIHHTLTGKRTGKRYRLGDPIKVCVARVDMDEREIDFTLA